MKYLYQFAIILLISAFGEILKHFIPLPIPASIYGLVIMLVALLTGIIKLEKIEKTADYLLEIMAVAFIPGGVGLIASWNELSNMLVPALVVIVVTTILVIGITGIVTQAMIRRKRNKQQEK